MTDHIARLRAFKLYFDRGQAVASDEVRDAMKLLDDYDRLAARVATREEQLRERAAQHMDAELRAEKLAEQLRLCNIDQANTEAELAEARGLLARLVEVLEPECRLDHNGNCQAHFVEQPCRVSEALAFLASTEGASGNGSPVRYLTPAEERTMHKALRETVTVVHEGKFAANGSGGRDEP